MSYFKAKMHKIPFPLGLRSRPSWGSLQRSPYILAVFKGGILLREETGKEGGRGRRRKREGKEVKEGEGQSPKYCGLDPPLG